MNSHTTTTNDSASAATTDASSRHTDFSQLTVEESLAALGATRKGLDQDEVAKRLIAFGPNEIKEKKRQSLLLLFLKQFKSLLIAVLFMAAILSYVTGNIADVYIIIIVVIVDACIGFFMELKAESAVSSLKKILNPLAKVVRANQTMTIAARELVPGDIIIVEEGDSIPADSRLLEGKNVRTQESSLTGESLPESKTADVLSGPTVMADQKNMLWKGTFVGGGYGTALVVHTGVRTEIGKVAEALYEIKPSISHFQKKINKLASQMGGASVFFALVLFIISYFTLNAPVRELLLISVAAMVSIIPEGLPSIIAIVLAIGARRMAKRNAIVREFTSTETLGAVSTIITDKTGTLTKNALTVRKLFIPDELEAGADFEVTGEGWSPEGTIIRKNAIADTNNDVALQRLLQIAAYCNNASIRKTAKPDNYELTGDPTEGALSVLAQKGGTAVDDKKKVDDLPFNSTMKLRATVVREDDGETNLLVVGAPEKILAFSTKILHPQGLRPMNPQSANLLANKIDDWSAQTMRVIGLAYRPFQKQKLKEDDINELIFVGLVGMIDPPRLEVPKAIQNCKRAGIRVIMATGDHISTAVAIARSVGIVAENDHHETLALT